MKRPVSLTKNVASLALGIALVSGLSIAPAFAASEASPATKEVPLVGTVSRDDAMIDVTVPTQVPFTINLNSDGQFISLDDASNSKIVNNDTTAKLSATVASVSDESGLLSLINLTLATKPLESTSVNVELGTMGQKGGEESNELPLRLAATAKTPSPAISLTSATVTPTITLARVSVVAP